MRISDWSSDVCSSDLVGRDHYRLRWKGDAGVFSSTLHEIDLPLGVPVTLPLDIAVGVSGSYSAIVDLVDPQVDLVAGSVPMAVLVAEIGRASGRERVCQYV